ncbi:MAG: ABC transporter permease [Alphaproteobacteria bacterium]
MAVETLKVPIEISGVSLKVKVRRANRRARTRALGLVAPLFFFLLLFFVLPIGYMLFYGAYNPELRNGLPDFAVALGQDSSEVPGEPVFRALAQDLAEARERREHTKAIKPVRQQAIGLWRVFKRTVKVLPENDVPSMKEWFIGFDPTWGEPDSWKVIRRIAAPYTTYYLVNAVDAQLTPDGSLELKRAEERVYLKILGNTFEISFWVTVIALILGYPVAYLLASVNERHSNLLMILVLLPFWTSILVRTYAWLMLLQTEGVVNNVMTDLGVFAEPVQMIHNRFGVYVAMVHILLPFMLLPIYSVMKSLGPFPMKAAANLGANPFRAFVHVYLPQTLPGVGAGCLLVFILSLGYYITPALVGGPKDTMISMMVAINVNTFLNWGMAGALGTILLIATVTVFLVYNRFLGLEKVRLS